MCIAKHSSKSLISKYIYFKLSSRYCTLFMYHYSHYDKLKSTTFTILETVLFFKIAVEFSALYNNASKLRVLEDFLNSSKLSLWDVSRIVRESQDTIILRTSIRISSICKKGGKKREGWWLTKAAFARERSTSSLHLPMIWLYNRGCLIQLQWNLSWNSPQTVRDSVRPDRALR